MSQSDRLAERSAKSKNTHIIYTEDSLDPQLLLHRTVKVNLGASLIHCPRVKIPSSDLLKLNNRAVLTTEEICNFESFITTHEDIEVNVRAWEPRVHMWGLGRGTSSDYNVDLDALQTTALTDATMLRSISCRTGACMPKRFRCKFKRKLSCVCSHYIHKAIRSLMSL